LASVGIGQKRGRGTGDKLAQEDQLPGQKIGKRWRFHKDAVDEWMRINPRKAGDNE